MTAKPERALRIVDLKVQNIKRVRAVHITPNGDSTVILGGKNGAGKTSVLDAIAMALGGARAIPSDPVRHGAKRGSIVADLGDLVVERVIAADGQTTLTVRDADGNRQRSPQKILDELCSRIAFDPLAFMSMQPGQQNEQLRQLLGLDFSQLDAERERCYAKRTDISRDAKAARSSSESIVVPPSTPEKAVVVTDLLAQLREAGEAAEKLRTHERATTTLRTDIESLQAELARIEASLMQKRMQLKQLERQAPPAAPDTDAISKSIATAEATNRQVHMRGQRDELERKANLLDVEAAKLTARIEAIDGEKAAAIAACSFPVPGLALGTDGPMLDGVPLEQASAAQKLRVSVALGLAMNPRLKVLLVRDASLLDETSLALVAEMAAAADAQVWLERVGDGDPTAVVIADGQVSGEVEPANDAAAASA
jgi:AAA domain